MEPRILILQPGGLSEVLLTTPLLRAARVRYPSAQITCVIRAEYASLIAHNPRVDALIEWRGSSVRELARAIRQSPDRRNSGAGTREGTEPAFTHRLDLENSRRTGLLRWLARGQWQLAPPAARGRRPASRQPGSLAERYFESGAGLGLEPDGGPPEVFLPRAVATAADGLLGSARGRLGLTRQLVAIAPGAAAPTRRWPEHHWVGLTRRLTEQGNDVVILDEADSPVPDRILAELPAPGER